MATQILLQSSQGIARVSKSDLIGLLRKNGVGELEALQGTEVTAENLIFLLRRRKYQVSEEFFKDLADVLDIPLIREQDLKNKEKLTTLLPYNFMKDNLVVPAEIGKSSITIATANPMNTKAIRVLGELFQGKNVSYKGRA